MQFPLLIVVLVILTPGMLNILVLNLSLSNNLAFPGMVAFSSSDDDVFRKCVHDACDEFCDSVMSPRCDDPNEDHTFKKICCDCPGPLDSWVPKYKEALRDKLLVSLHPAAVCNISVITPVTESGSSEVSTTVSPKTNLSCLEVEIQVSNDLEVLSVDWTFILKHGGFMLVALLSVDWAYLVWFSSLSSYEALG